MSRQSVSANNRHPPETPEGAAFELFKEILRAEEKASHNMGDNLPPRARMLALYAECLQITSGHMAELRERLLH